MYFGCVCFKGDLGFLNCDDICMCVVNKQFELLEYVFDSVYVDLQYEEMSLTFTAGSRSLCCVCGRVVVFGLFVRLSWYPMWMWWLLRQCDGARLTAMLVWGWMGCGGVCVCIWLGAAWVERRGGEWRRGLGLGLYESCGNRGSVGRVYVFVVAVVWVV